MLASMRPGLAVRESIGSLQGKLHSWYRESEPPYFTLRELTTRSLVKCFYEESDYDAVVKAVKTKNQVVHVHGRVFTDTIQQCIREIKADRIVPADPFTFRDFEGVWNEGKTQ
jgi:hypothetical protein